MSKILITEKLLKKIIRNSIKNILIRENYNIELPEELMEFMKLSTNLTGLNVDIFVDDSKSYKRNNRKPILFARNSYDSSIKDFIPFSIDKWAKIMAVPSEYCISYDDIFDIQDFIVQNLQLLLLLADMQIKQIDFVQRLKKVTHLVAESKVLTEMATLRKEDSQLPMDIWLDEDNTFQGHAPRIKFRASREQRNTRQFSSIIISDNPTIENFPKNSPITKKDIQKLKKFIITNKDLLLRLAKGEIDYTTDFLPNVTF